MAVRPVFAAKEKVPFYEMAEVEFEWNGGFAKTQKQKNIRAIHESFSHRWPGKKVLEISSKSMQEHGEALSAFFLPKYVPKLGRSIPVECVFQSGKVFQKGGPYKDLMLVTPREAKRDARLKASGSLVHFTFDDQNFPLVPKTFFYDYIYINALLENETLAQTALQYDAFTDVEFNPNASINCQAKAAATFVSLSRMGLIEKVKAPESFLSLYQKRDALNSDWNHEYAKSADGVMKTELGPGLQTDLKPTEAPEPDIAIGTTVKHKKFGAGTVIKMDSSSLTIQFSEAGVKELGRKWCMVNCEFEAGV